MDEAITVTSLLIIITVHHLLYGWCVSRYGVCSGWLSRLAQQIMSTTTESSVDPPSHQEKVSSVYFMADVVYL